MTADKKKELFGDPTVEMRDAPARRPVEGLKLLIFGDTVQATRVLPAAGTVTIGRGEMVDVRIDDPSVSRQHAALHVGEVLRVEDLGSANGTRVREERLEAGTQVQVAFGEVFEIGSTMALVQRRTGPVARPRRLGTHGYFEARLEDEVGRSQRTSSPFAVMRVRLMSDTSIAVLQEQLTDSLRAGDLLAHYGPIDYELLLPDTSPTEADQFARSLVQALEATAAQVRCGTACFPRDGQTPEALIAFAGGQVAADSDAEVHHRIVVEDEVMRRLYALATRVASNPISVLILGETGAGKEVLAETIHKQSPRAERPFLRLNCAALSETLLESELFGHEKGAFTGAVSAKPGLLESADTGTVFLDEIGELPLSLQVKLLRVLEERVVMRVGSVKPKRIDVRFVAATNRNLEEEVLAGRFRQDLYFRLNGISMVIPPLRERPREIELLARQFITEAAERSNLSHAPELTAEALAQLKSYGWPGNIRELRNVIERAVLLAGQEPITLEHLPVEKMETTLLLPRDRPSDVALAHPGALMFAQGEEVTKPTHSAADLRSAVEEVEKQRILDALEQCAGNQTRVARMLGISRTTLLARLDQFGIPRPRKKK